MPSLKNLQCSVRWASNRKALAEFRTAFADGSVETWILVPENMSGVKGCNGDFYVEVKTEGYVAPGIAMFVYIDGIYQCNRNRRNLTMSIDKDQKANGQVTMKAKQHELFFPDGSMAARPWTFSPITLSKGDSPGTYQSSAELRKDQARGKYVGLIEIVVLRCTPTERTSLPLSIFRVPVGVIEASQQLSKPSKAVESGTIAGTSTHKSPTAKRTKRANSAWNRNKGRGIETENESFKTLGEWQQGVRAAAEKVKERLKSDRSSSTSSDDSERETHLTCAFALDAKKILANIEAAKTSAKCEVWGSWSTSALAKDQKKAVGRNESHIRSGALEVGISKVAATHQLRTGEERPYLHKLAKPSYIDSHQSPYAVFRFYYRDKITLERILDISNPEGEIEERERLETLSKEDLVTQLLKLKASKRASTGGHNNCGFWPGLANESKPAPDQWGLPADQGGVDSKAWGRVTVDLDNSDKEGKQNEGWSKDDNDGSSGRRSEASGWKQSREKLEAEMPSRQKEASIKWQDVSQDAESKEKNQQNSATAHEKQNQGRLVKQRGGKRKQNRKQKHGQNQNQGREMTAKQNLKAAETHGDEWPANDVKEEAREEAKGSDDGSKMLGGLFDGNDPSLAHHW